MKKTIFFVIVLIFTMSSTFAFANKADRKTNSVNAVAVKTENALSEVEISRLTNRVEEIRNLDTSEMSLKEKSELKKELRDIKKNVEKAGGTVYIGGAALVLIIILIILLV